MLIGEWYRASSLFLLLVLRISFCSKQKRPHCWLDWWDKLDSRVTEDSGSHIFLCLLLHFQKSIASIIVIVPSHRFPIQTTGAEECIWGEETICDMDLNMAMKGVLRERLVYCRMMVSYEKEPERGLRAFFCLFPFLKFIIFQPQRRLFISQWSRSLWLIILCFGWRVHFA